MPEEESDVGQELFRPALQLTSEAEQALAANKFELVDGLMHIADTWLQFLLHSNARDLSAATSREKSLADPVTRPLFGRAITLAKNGLKHLNQDNPRRSAAELKLAAFYYKCARHWEPSTDDEQAEQEFEQLEGIIARQTALAKQAIAALPDEEPTED